MSTSRNVETTTDSYPIDGLRLTEDETLVQSLLTELEQNGIVRLPSLISNEDLKSMRAAFRARLTGLRWNDYDGFEKTECQRHMVEDVLTVERGFLKVALHPLVKQILKLYLGERFELVEAKGWRSLPTTRDFHGWHGDAWYEQEGATDIPREVKLAIYLTDVKSGAFNFIKGTHRKYHPRPIPTVELGEVPEADLVEVFGQAGSAFLFDTSGIHRQGVPILEPREAVFFNYHDPNVPLQSEDVQFYRYHPLLLNAAFLGNLSREDEGILGFGNMNNYSSGFVQPDRHPRLHQFFSVALNTTLRFEQLRERVKARWQRWTRR